MEACLVCIMLNQAIKLGKAKKLGKEKDHEKTLIVDAKHDSN